jgi:hypothetical protein
LAWNKRSSAHFVNDYRGMPAGFEPMAEAFWLTLREAARRG